MRAISDALYNRMAADGVLTALLGQWDGRPSIITFRPVPEGAGLPLVLAAETVADTDRDLIRARGREIQRDVAIYGDATTHFDVVEVGAERIRELFHRQPLIIDGHHAASVTCRGPVSAPSDPGETGRIVTLTLLVYETA